MAIPLSIRLFLSFSAAVSLLDLSILVPGMKVLKETTVPYTGWAAAMPYMFALGAWPSLFKPRGHVTIDARTLRRYLTLACGMLAIGVVVGIVDFLMFANLRDDTSPWLRYSPWRPLWSVVLPIVWGTVLWKQRAMIDLDPARAELKSEARL